MVISRIGAEAAVVHVGGCLIGRLGRARRLAAHGRRGEANRNSGYRQQLFQHDDPPHPSLEKRSQQRRSVRAMNLN
jgi:hypothetical protein